jgi:tripartite-type tricarboxylate transporter receptor subunit TctC
MTMTNLSFMRRACVGMLGAALAALATLAPAQTPAWPDRPIKLLVPFAAGGPADAISRDLSERLSHRLGQAVVVENRPGGGGDMGTGLVARATPDGYTLLFGAGANLAVSPAITKSVPFDSLKDFIPISTIAQAPNILIVNESVPAKNLKELVALGKKTPGGLSFASGGKGSSGHLAAELLKTATGVPFVHVPYKGQAQAIADMLGGHIPVMFAAVTGTREYIAAGKLRVLAITSAARSPLAPGVPTVAEQGYPGFQVLAWWGVLAPVGTPAGVVTRLSKEINAILAEPEVRKIFENYGTEPFPQSSEQFAQFLRSELDRAAKLAAAAGIPKE